MSEHGLIGHEPATEDGRRSVLVVDDEPVMRLLARESLQAAGFEVEEAENGAEAVDRFRELRPSIVLMDVNMPVMNGFQACLKLRRSSEGRHAPILMMTGLDDVDSIRRAYEVGATDFVNKPINWLVLGHRVEYMLRASQTREALRRSGERLANAQRIARLGTWELFPETGSLACSEELCRILGLAPDQGPTDLENLMNLVHPEERGLVEQAVQDSLNEPDPVSVEYRFLRPDGEERWVRQEARLQRTADGRIVHLTAAVQDVTQRKLAAETIRRLSYFDELTGLPNRRSFAERFTSAVATAQRYDRTMAVLFLDLDRLKRVNDTLGRKAGDQVLRETAERMLGCLRASDMLTRPASTATGGRVDFVARFGGDEFVVLLTEIGDVQDAAAVATRLGRVLSRPFEVGGEEIFLTASIGIAICPHDGEDVDLLIQRAGTARHHAKEQGGDAYHYYDDWMNASAMERLSLENGLRRGIDRREFVLWYQPQFEIATGRLVGAESLIRWRHPERGLLLPLQFIGLAEETGLITEIGRWALHTACRQASKWSRAGTPVRVGVNVSARQFGAGGFDELVAEAIHDAGLAARWLELELTERTLMDDLEGACMTLDALRSLGLRLSIDDFGVAYSSLNYLTRFAVDCLKIDRSFLEKVTEERDKLGIVRAVISLGKSLDLEVIAEGVETRAQLELLQREGCDLVQGYLLGRPMPAEKLTGLLEEQAGAAAGSPLGTAAAAS